MTTTSGSPSVGEAGRRWAEALESWAIPDELIAAAPVSPHGFDVRMFARIADDAEPDTPSIATSRTALPAGGSVLDVGCGGGAGSLPLADRSGLLVGVDEGAGMLQAYAERAAAAGVDHREIQGRWPDVEADAPTADVVVCHNVVYNVPDLVPFVHALTGHARSRVVVELTAEHPLAWLHPYWRELHELERPDRPVAGDAVAVAREAGYDVHVEHWERTRRHEREHDDLVGFLRQRLCLGPERDGEVTALLERFPPPETRGMATLWWPPAAG